MSLQGMGYKCRKLLPEFFIKKAGKRHNWDNYDGPVEVLCWDNTVLLSMECTFDGGYAIVNWECGYVVRK